MSATTATSVRLAPEKELLAGPCILQGPESQCRKGGTVEEHVDRASRKIACDCSDATNQQPFTLPEPRLRRAGPHQLERRGFGVFLRHHGLGAQSIFASPGEFGALQANGEHAAIRKAELHFV